MHAHTHEDGHSHAHSYAHYGRAFGISLALNVGIVAIEIAYGIAASSMALIADAGHNLIDVLGLVLAWVGVILAQRRPSQRRTYGLRRISMLAAFANAMVLLLATGGIVVESIRRVAHPDNVHGPTVIAVAAATAVINAASALLFMGKRKGDLTMRAAFVHLAGDAALALGVLVAGVLITLTGWDVLDPIVSLVLSALILVSTWSLLRASVGLLLDVVPERIDPGEIRDYLTRLPGVFEVHDLHIWALSTTETALTAHLVMPSGACGPHFIGDVCRTLHDEFRIEHSTLQVDPEDPSKPCRLAPDDTV